MTADGRRGAVVVAIPIIMLSAALTFAFTRDDGRPGPAPTTPTSSKPSFGEALGEGIFGDAVQVGFQADDRGGVLSIPECLGGVVQLSAVTLDLKHTIWSIEASAAGGSDVNDIRLGVVPDGFREMDPFDEAEVDETMIVLVEGTERRGAVRVAASGGPVPPGPCS